MLAGAPLPVSLYTRLWQEARQLFGGLPLFKKSAWTGRRWALNKQIINDWTEFQDWRLLWKVQHRSLLLSLSARLKLPPATCGFCAFLQVKQSYLVLTEERLNAINDWHVSEADRMHTHTQTHTHTPGLTWSVSASPRDIFSMFSRGWKSSPSYRGQPSWWVNTHGQKSIRHTRNQEGGVCVCVCVGRLLVRVEATYLFR